MKKLIFFACLCLSTILVGCMNNSKDFLSPDNQPVDPTGEDDGGYRKNTDWVDTLRPPLNPNVVEYQETIPTSRTMEHTAGSMVKDLGDKSLFRN